MFKEVTRECTNIKMLKPYSFVLICWSAVMLTYIMFFGNDYIRGRQPLASIIFMTSSGFNSTKHKVVTMNAEQLGNWECCFYFD